ncbi:hypothetical protein KAW64_03440 [bacterium]|nr:hypothetical protein [bacterium]
MIGPMESMSRWAGAAVVLAVLGLQGCAPLPMFQSPAVLEPGEVAIGAGVVRLNSYPGIEEEPPVYLPSLWFRGSLGDNTDFGMNAGSPWNLAVDIKREFVHGPIFLSGDVGLSWIVTEMDMSPMGPSEETKDAVLFRPALLCGTDRVYGGVSATWRLFGKYPTDFMPGIMVGASVGDRFRLMFEYSRFWYSTDGQAATIAPASYGVGLQGTW